MGRAIDPMRQFAKTRSGPRTAPPTIGFDESPAGYSLGELLSSRRLHELRENLKQLMDLLTS